MRQGKKYQLDALLFPSTSRRRNRREAGLPDSDGTAWLSTEPDDTAVPGKLRAKACTVRGGLHGPGDGLGRAAID